MNIYYIHGFGSRANSTTGKEIKKILPETHILTYDSLDYFEYNLNKLRNEIIDDENTFIIGNSLGGFYGFWLTHELKVPGILINPCSWPEEILPELSNCINPSVIHSYPKIENHKFDRVPRHVVIGLNDKVINPEQNILFWNKCSLVETFEFGHSPKNISEFINKDIIEKMLNNIVL